MRYISLVAGLVGALNALPVAALSLAPEEFSASRQLACVLAQQSLGHLTEDEYGALAHGVLDDFDDTEQEHILSSALGYVDGLMFDIESGDSAQVNQRLTQFVDSPACLQEDYYRVTVRL